MRQPKITRLVYAKFTTCKVSQCDRAAWRPVRSMDPMEFDVELAVWPTVAARDAVLHAEARQEPSRYHWQPLAESHRA